jgi:TolA-binding protein
MIRSKHIEEISRFLEGNMPEEEMIDMEVRYIQDPAFRQEVDSVRLLIEGIRTSGRQTTKEEKLERLRLAQFDEISFSKTTGRQDVPAITRRRKLVATLSIAASVLILIFAISPLFNPKSVDPGQLFVTHFKPAVSVVSIGTRSYSEDQEREAYQAYRLGDYADALAIFESEIDESPYRLTDLFYLGNCYLTEGRWLEASQAFDEVIQARTPLAEDGKWYLALSYLQLDRLDQAQELLEEIAADNQVEGNARKLLRKLR